MKTDVDRSGLGDAMNYPLKQSELEEGDFKTIVVATADMQGRLVGKWMSPQSFFDVISRGPSISSCAFAWDLEQSVEGRYRFSGPHTGWHDVVLCPDLSTIRHLAWREATAFLMADVLQGPNGDILPVAPRTILKGQVEQLRRLGYIAQIGTELEFFLLRNSHPYASTNNYQLLTRSNNRRSQDAISHRTNRYSPFFQYLQSRLDLSAIRSFMGQPEWGRGQWEMTLMHQEPIELADRHSLLKLAVKEVAQENNLAATFMARPFEDDVGSSGHIHISLRDVEGKYVFYDSNAEFQMSDTMRFALGGILENIPNFMVFYAPSINSYRRRHSQLYSGWGKSWGIDNRSVSCRIVGESPESLRIELRIPGADINPYLAIAGILASVCDGVRRKTNPGEPTVGDAYVEVDDCLPKHMLEAIDLFSRSECARFSVGENVVEHYASHAQFEWDEFMRIVTGWEKRRYFEDI